MADAESPKLRVLVVDDDPDTPLLCKALTVQGKFNYEVSNTAERGLIELERSGGSIDIVLVDFELDDSWSALTFIDRAKQIRPELPYFIWSQYSNEDIISELRRYTIEQILGLSAAGFVEKNSISNNPDILDETITQGLEEFRQQFSGRLQSTLLGAFGELDVALTQTSAACRAVEGADAQAPESGKFRFKSVRLRLNRVEATLRRMLGYKPATTGWREDADDALTEVASGYAGNRIPSALRVPLSDLARHAEPNVRARALSALTLALARRTPSESIQRDMAEYVSELVEFTIYSGHSDWAMEVSGEIWRKANRSWAFVPKMSCAVTHSLALASSGKSDLAEQLASSMLIEAGTLLSESELDEVTRSIFAELDDFAKLAVA